MTSIDDVRAWMEGYLVAWCSNDPRDLEALFTDDAVYERRPNDRDPSRGRDAIVQTWLRLRDAPDSWTFDYTPLGFLQPAEPDAGADTTALVQGATRYLDGRPTYENLFFITLAPDGRATHFLEWSYDRPGTGTGTPARDQGQSDAPQPTGA